MDFKPLRFFLYLTFPKLVTRNHLQTGHEKDGIDFRKERNSIMNILQFTYDSQAKIYN